MHAVAKVFVSPSPVNNGENDLNLYREGDESFPPSSRFHTHHDYRRVQNSGTKFVTRNFVFYARLLPSGESSRLGLTVSRRVGNAVIRNRVKRLLRDFVRREVLHRPPACEVSIIARSGAATLTSAALFDELSIWHRHLSGLIA